MEMKNEITQTNRWFDDLKKVPGHHRRPTENMEIESNTGSSKHTKTDTLASRVGLVE
jgi:hypothetical protein